MTLDDLEFKAARIAEGGYPLHDQEAVSLARALLAVLPAIRSATAYSDACVIDDGKQRPKAMSKTSVDLQVRLMDMLKQLDGEIP